MKRITRLIVTLAVVLAAAPVAVAASPASCQRLTVAVNGTPRPCGMASTADTFGTAWQRSWLWSGARLTGQVLGAQGGPSVGTVVTVSQTALDGSGGVTVAQTTTNAAGRYVLVVGRSRSRILTVTAAGNSQMVVEVVSPNVFLHVSARRHATLIVTGRVLAGVGAFPTVEIEDRVRATLNDPAHWVTFAWATISPGGLYRTRYVGTPGTVDLHVKVRAVTPATPVGLAAGVSGIKGTRILP